MFGNGLKSQSLRARHKGEVSASGLHAVWVFLPQERTRNAAVFEKGSLASRGKNDGRVRICEKKLMRRVNVGSFYNSFFAAEVWSDVRNQNEPAANKCACRSSRDRRSRIIRVFWEGCDIDVSYLAFNYFFLAA